MSGPKEADKGFEMLDLSAALAVQHECPLDLTRTLPGRLVWYGRICTRCRRHISDGWLSFATETGEFCQVCWEEGLGAVGRPRRSATGAR